MSWFDQMRRILSGYYPANRPSDIVGYLQGSASAGIWRSMEGANRHQKLVLGSIEPTRQDWIDAGVLQRADIQTIRLPVLSGFIVLYAGFPGRPWGELHTVTPDAINLGFPSSLQSWERNYRVPR